MKTRLLCFIVANYLSALAQGRTQINRAYLQTDLDANGKAVTNLAAPVLSGDAARKGYVDSAVAAAIFGTSSGQVLFNKSGAITGTNNFFWDATNFRLGLRTTSPTHTITIGSGGDGLAYYSTADQTTNFVRLRLGFSASHPILVAETGGSALPTALELGVTNGSYASSILLSANNLVPVVRMVVNGTNRFVIDKDGHIGIGTDTPSASSLIDLVSTTGGFLMPRVTTTQRDAISSPATGLLVVNTTTSSIDLYNGSSWQSLAAGSVGTVTSVGLTVPSWLSVSGSPVTSSGSLAVTAASGQAANQVLATPDGTTGAVSPRQLVAADIPSLAASKITSGTIDTNRFPTLVKDLGALSATAGDVYYYDGTNFNRLPLGSTGYVLTVTNGLPVWLPSSGGGGGSGVTTDVTSLGWSGTNITGFDCATNGESFYLLVTNNCLFGASTFSNLPAKTAYKTYTLCLQMDGTGGYTVKITNSVVGWEDGSTGGQPTIKTQANAVSYIYLHTDLTTNSTLVGTPNLNIQR